MEPLPAGFTLLNTSFAAEQAEQWLHKLLDVCNWQQRRITVYGKQHLEPRLSAWYGDAEATYRYANINLQPEAWTPLLLNIKAAVEAVAEHSFNSVLLNYYRSGQDSMGYHADDEPELGQQPLIASLSLGAERVFRLKPKRGKLPDGRASLGFTLPHGSLLLMHGHSQRDWLHALPKTRRPIAPRISLTFRLIQYKN